MSERYYKAVQPDGTDFRTGTINYAAALLSDEVIRHPSAKKVRDDARTYLSVSVAPADCTGFSWPCRLFRVEPVGRVMASLSASPNKRAVSALKVVEELPAWMALGPNGEAVAALIERASRLNIAEAKAPYATREATRDAWNAAREAAREANRNAAWHATWEAIRDTRDAAWDATRDAAWDATRDAAWDAALALLVRDRISQEHFDILYGPWAKMIDKESLISMPSTHTAVESW